MTRTARAAQLIMLTSLAAASSRETPAADWSGKLDASMSLAYVTNPEWIPGSNVGDEFAQLSVGGVTTAESELGQLSVTPRFTSTRYDHDTALDIDAGSLDLAYQRKLERGSWAFEGQTLTDSTITSELGTTGLTETNRRHYANTLSLNYQYLATERLTCQVQGAWQGTRYTDALRFGLTDYTYGSALVSATWSFSDRMQGSLALSANRLAPDVGFRQDSDSVTLQLARSITEQYSWRASVGATHVDAGSAGTSTDSVFEAVASRQTERVHWDLSVKRAVLPIGLGFLAPQTSVTLGVTVATTERSVLNLSVAGLRTDEVKFGGLVFFSGTTWAQGSLEWRYNFAQNWTVSGTYQQGRSRDLEHSTWANGGQARLGIVWQSGRL